MHYKETLSRDKKLGALLAVQKQHKLELNENVCIYLCGSIMSQQLSTRVAAVIHQRFLNIYNGNEPTPEQILETSHETLRSIGLSNAKCRYVHNVARFASENKLDWNLLQDMDNEELIAHLRQIKGVGRWTAEMILMFALAKEDIFAIDDLGIQNAMKRLYRLDDRDKKKFRKELLRISAKWSPYRTYACLYLWGWRDNAPRVGKEKQPRSSAKQKHRKAKSPKKDLVKVRGKVHKRKKAKKRI